MPVKTPEEAKEFVRTWMVDRKVYKNDTTSDAVHFQYDGICSTGVNFSIQHPKDMIRVVGVTVKMLIDANHLKMLTQFSSQKRAKFLKNLSDRLIFVPPAFQFGPAPEHPEWLFFVKEISYDELTEGRLMDAVDQLSRAVIFASSIFIDTFGEPREE
jgi:hypothetical protein